MKDKIKDGYTIVETYKIITNRKVESLDSVLSLKEALDLWWNRIDFEIDGVNYFGYIQIDDGKYYIENGDNGAQVKGENLKKVLSQTIKLAKGWDIDTDGNPIIKGEIVKKVQKLM